MARIQFSETIHASSDQVFAAFSDIANFAGKVKAIVRTEKLTPGPLGVGTRFRETRKMFGKEATEEMTVTGFDPPRLFELSSQACGSKFSFTFHFIPAPEGTRLDVEINSQPLTWMGRCLSPLVWLISGMMKKSIMADTQDLKKLLETK